MKEIIASLEDIDSVVEYILDSKKNIFILEGNLASGKTTLIQHIAKKLGIKSQINSPTFSLMQSFDNKLFHYDLYNHDFEKFLELGFLDELQKDGLHFIEWGGGACENMLLDIGIPFVKISIIMNDADRIYRIEE